MDQQYSGAACMNDGIMVLMSRNTEFLRIEADGRFFVKGNEVEGDLAVRDALLEFVAIVRGPRAVVADREPDASREIDWGALNPGICQTIRHLRKAGFDTIDSSDGETHDHGCDLPYPYVHILVERGRLASEADRLKIYLEDRGVAFPTEEELAIASTEEGENAIRLLDIQGNYSPMDGMAIVSLFGLADKDWLGKR